MRLVYRCILHNFSKPGYRRSSTDTAKGFKEVPADVISACGRSYPVDEWTNVSPKILSYLGKDLYIQKHHPLSLLRQRIVNYFYKKFVGRTGNAIFSVYDRLSPVVTVEQNFDSLLVPRDHPSRKKSDCYYFNKNYLLRGHTTAHQNELIRMGLNNFLVVGDVYRRDEIDSSHFPVFHQLDAVRLCTPDEVFRNAENACNLKIFEQCNHRTPEKQECHSLTAVKLMELEMKNTLAGLAHALFGQGTKLQWVTKDVYFPFTHPSWELEVFSNDKWIEILGCGIMEHKILENAGAQDRIGWAFGMGLERIAMILYNIPDIRLFWSKDTGFLSQFQVDDPNAEISYKPISRFPQCSNDISFWLPDTFDSNDFYDLIRSIGGDIIEQVNLLDQFVHPKTGKMSHCYRITYRHMERNLTQNEVNVIHKKIATVAEQKLGVKVR